tara:strand:+ start:166 stop:444 length:279 start_codon:yes stop_codon:yes gene_type:complete
MKPEAAIKALDSLRTGKGWAYLKAIMEKEVLHAAYQLADNPSMTEKEVDFRRGAMWASRQLIDLPDKAYARLEAEVALNSAKADMETNNGTR